MKLDRKYMTFKIDPEDREFIQDLHIGRTKTRHEMLLQLVEIAKNIHIPHKSPKVSIRMGLPEELHKILVEKSEDTGQPIVKILLAVANEYAKNT